MSSLDAKASLNELHQQFLELQRRSEHVQSALRHPPADAASRSLLRVMNDRDLVVAIQETKFQISLRQKRHSSPTPPSSHRPKNHSSRSARSRRFVDSTYHHSAQKQESDDPWQNMAPSEPQNTNSEAEERVGSDEISCNDKQTHSNTQQHRSSSRRRYRPRRTSARRQLSVPANVRIRPRLSVDVISSAKPGKRTNGSGYPHFKTQRSQSVSAIRIPSRRSRSSIRLAESNDLSSRNRDRDRDYDDTERQPRAAQERLKQAYREHLRPDVPKLDFSATSVAVRSRSTSCSRSHGSRRAPSPSSRASSRAQSTTRSTPRSSRSRAPVLSSSRASSRAQSTSRCTPRSSRSRSTTRPHSSRTVSPPAATNRRKQAPLVTHIDLTPRAVHRRRRAASACPHRPHRPARPFSAKSLQKAFDEAVSATLHVEGGDLTGSQLASQQLRSSAPLSPARVEVRVRKRTQISPDWSLAVPVADVANKAPNMDQSDSAPKASGRNLNDSCSDADSDDIVYVTNGFCKPSVVSTTRLNRSPSPRESPGSKYQQQPPTFFDKILSSSSPDFGTLEEMVGDSARDFEKQRGHVRRRAEADDSRRRHQRHINEKCIMFKKKFVEADARLSTAMEAPRRHINDTADRSRSHAQHWIGTSARLDSPPGESPRDAKIASSQLNSRALLEYGRESELLDALEHEAVVLAKQLKQARRAIPGARRSSIRTPRRRRTS